MTAAVGANCTPASPGAAAAPGSLADVFDEHPFLAAAAAERRSIAVVKLSKCHVSTVRNTLPAATHRQILSPAASLTPPPHVKAASRKLPLPLPGLLPVLLVAVMVLTALPRLLALEARDSDPLRSRPSRTVVSVAARAGADGAAGAAQNRSMEYRSAELTQATCTTGCSTYISI